MATALLRPTPRFLNIFLVRLVLLSSLFALELVAITIWLDGATLVAYGGVLAWLGHTGTWLLRGAVAFASLFTLGATMPLRSGHTPPGLALSEAQNDPIRWSYLATHLGLIFSFVFAARFLFGTPMGGVAGAAVAFGWLALGVAAIVAGACAFMPPAFWFSLRRVTGNLWIYVLAISIAICVMGAFARELWDNAADWTFFLVSGILRLFLSNVFANASTKSIGTAAFHVEIAPACSGLEGAALILGFCGLWLWLLRDEFRFPRAILLAPASVALLFFLNAVRIAALILIGNAGAPDVALGGFHSQAGWIAFNAVAVGLMIATRHMHWITVEPAGGAGALRLAPASVSSTPVTTNPAAPYLAPFLLILASAMVAHAASGGFEWLYSLRLVAAGAALWIFRDVYRKLDWHFGWEAVAVGVFVFALWLAGDWIAGAHPKDPLAGAPSAAGASWIAVARTVWLALRLLSGLVTVPIAEELAFRGYLIRRIISPDFERLNPAAYTVLSLAVSSLIFGFLHGSRWIVGTVAGLLYAAVLIRRGRIGDAVAAHAITNGLLAASVLVTGQWNLS